MRQRLAQLRSFIWWTVPLYLIFLAAGAYASRLALTMELEALFGILGAFGALDAMVLWRLRGIEAREMSSLGELHRTREQIDRLARFLLFSGSALGIAFAVAFAFLLLR